MEKFITYQDDDGFYYILSVQGKSTRNKDYDLYRYSLVKTDSLNVERMNSKHIVDKIFIGEFAINDDYINSQLIVCLGLLNTIIYKNTNKVFNLYDRNNNIFSLLSGCSNFDNIETLRDYPKVANLLTSYSDVKVIEKYEKVRMGIYKIRMYLEDNEVFDKEDYKKLYGFFYGVKKFIKQYNLNFDITDIDIKKLKG